MSMLDALGDAGIRDFPSVTRRIRFAEDAKQLWFLRGELMAALASMGDEASARQKITQISDMFRGLLPSALHSRPSPLVG